MPWVKGFKNRTLLGGGLLMVLLAFVYDLVFAGIPYQDAPPKLVARYAFHQGIARTAMSAGLIVVFVALVGGMIRLLSRVFLGRSGAKRRADHP